MTAPRPNVAESDSCAMLPTLATIIIARAGQAIRATGTRPTSPDDDAPLVDARDAISPGFLGGGVDYLVVVVPSIPDTKSSYVDSSSGQYVWTTSRS